MSRLLVSLMLSLVATHAAAQAGKPTRTQTVEYIKANYRQAIDYHAQKEKESATLYSLQTVEGTIRDLAVDIADTRVTFTFHEVLVNQVTGAIRVEGEAVSLDDQKELANRRVRVEFDLKEIEAIEGATAGYVYDIAYEQSESTGLYPMYLVFKAAGGKRAIAVTADGETKQVTDVWVPYSTDAVEGNHQALRELENEQLFKAFQHLRKLSGAPEPVRF
jgi:DNA-directed RNA polymerase beta subunit